MNNRDLLKLALGGLATGFCLVALSSCTKTPHPSPQEPPQAEEDDSRCSGGPTCASCTVPSDCSDVSQAGKTTSSKALQQKRQKMASLLLPQETECKKS